MRRDAPTSPERCGAEDGATSQGSTILLDGLPLSPRNPDNDHEKLLEKAGPNSQVAGVMRFSSTAEVWEREPILRDYLAQLMIHAEAGTKPPKAKTDIELPSELVEALDSDPELSEA